MTCLKLCILFIAFFFQNIVTACENCGCMPCCAECLYKKHDKKDRGIDRQGSLSESVAFHKKKTLIPCPKGVDGRSSQEDMDYLEFIKKIPESVKINFSVMACLRKPKDFKERMELFYKYRETFAKVLSLRGDKLKGFLRYLSMRCNENELFLLQYSFLDLANDVDRSYELMGGELGRQDSSYFMTAVLTFILSIFGEIIEFQTSGLFDDVFIRVNKFYLCDSQYETSYLNQSAVRHIGTVEDTFLWRTALVSGGILALVTVFLPMIRDKLIPCALHYFTCCFRKVGCCKVNGKEYRMTAKDEALFIKMVVGLSKQDAGLFLKRSMDPEFMKFFKDASLLMCNIDIVAELVNSLMELEKKNKQLFVDLVNMSDKEIASMKVLRILSKKNSDDRKFNRLFYELASNILDEVVAVKYRSFKWLFDRKSLWLIFVVFFVSYLFEFFMEVMKANNSEAVVEIPAHSEEECLGFNLSHSREEMYNYFGNETTKVSGSLYSLHTDYYTRRLISLMKLATSFVLVTFADWVDKQRLHHKKTKMMSEVGFGDDVYEDNDSVYVDMSDEGSTDDEHSSDEEAELDGI